MRSPTDASLPPLRASAHGSRSMRIATPSSCRTSTDYLPGALRKIPHVIAQLGRRSAQRLTAGRDWRERRGLSLDSRHLRRRQENTLSNLSCARHK